MRKGMGKGKGKGYKNLIPKDPKVHSDSAMGRKQPQRIKNIMLCDFDPKLNQYEKGDSTRISIEEPLYDKNGNRIDGEMGRILKLENNVATVKLDDQRIVDIGLGLLTAKQIVYQPVKEDNKYQVAPEEKYEKSGEIKEATKKDKITPTELAQATGSEWRYKWSPIFPQQLTDGANYLAIRGGAYWLMDIVGTYQYKSKFRREPFQTWTLKKLKETDKNMARLEATDGDGNILARQNIPYTDFFDKYQGDEIKLFFDNGVIMLPSEY